MLFKFSLVSIIVLVLLQFNLEGQDLSLKNFSFEIAPFLNFKSSALIFTFDDGSKSQFDVGVDILNQFDYKGTFFITTSFIGDPEWEKINEMIKNGHEIGSHTISHPKLVNISEDEAHVEIVKSKEIIEHKIPSYKCTSFSYPHGSYNKSILKVVEKNYIGARTVNEGYNNFENLTSYCLFSTFFFTSKTQIKLANKWVNGSMHHNKILIESLHGFNGEGYQPISSLLFRKHLQYIKSKEKFLWIATFGDVVRYLRERQNAVVNLLDSTDYSYQFHLGDNLPDSIFDHPLTLQMKVPNSWCDIQIAQNGQIVEYQLKNDPQGNQFVIFNAIPDRGSIKILSLTPYNQELEKCSNCNLTLYPLPFYNFFSILWNPLYHGDFVIFNLRGQLIEKGLLAAGIKRINTEFFEVGTYIIIINLQTEKGNIQQIKKIIKE